jgi:hypothetical protein
MRFVLYPFRLVYWPFRVILNLSTWYVFDDAANWVNLSEDLLVSYAFCLVFAPCTKQSNKLLILLVMRFSANPPWGVFWHSYFVLADNYDDFIAPHGKFSLVRTRK